MLLPPPSFLLLCDPCPLMRRSRAGRRGCAAGRPMRSMQHRLATPRNPWRIATGAAPLGPSKPITHQRHDSWGYMSPKGRSRAACETLRKHSDSIAAHGFR